MKQLIFISKGSIKIDDGLRVVSSYCDDILSPGVLFVSSSQNIVWQEAHPSRFAIPHCDGELFTLRGNFYVSKAGKPCFEISPDGIHIFVLCEYNYDQTEERGKYPFPKTMYYTLKDNPAYGIARKYWVVPVDWKYPIEKEIEKPEE